MTLSKTAGLRGASLSLLAALVFLSPPAKAADVAPSPEGLEKVTTFLQGLLGAGNVGPSAPVSVTQEADHYAIHVDLPAAFAGLKDLDFGYDSGELNYSLVEQDDGLWKVVQNETVALSYHMKDLKTGGLVRSAMTMEGLKYEALVDTALGWLKSGAASADKTAVDAGGPGLSEKFDFGALKATFNSDKDDKDFVSTTVEETIANVAFDVSAQSVQPQAPSIAVHGKSDEATASVGLGGFKPNSVLDLWRLFVANPGREPLAEHEDELKTGLVDLISGPLNFSESVGMRTFALSLAIGDVTLANFKAGFAAKADGGNSAFEEHFAADGLTLPANVVPAAFAPIVPTSFDIGFKVSGMDLTAAAKQAIGDMELKGDGPIFSDGEGGVVGAKLIGPDPIVLEIPPSHVLGPKLDLTLEGKGQYADGVPTGAATITIRGFDATIDVLKGLPGFDAQALPAIAMAKGLAKTGPDGALIWVIELGPDGTPKVNGLPLPKMPG